MNKIIIEQVAKTLCELDGKNPNALVSYGHNKPEINKTYGFEDHDPYRDGAWVEFISDAVKYIAVYKILQAAPKL